MTSLPPLEGQETSLTSVSTVDLVFFFFFLELSRRHNHRSTSQLFDYGFDSIAACTPVKTESDFWASE